MKVRDVREGLKPLKPSEVDILLQDFGEFSRKACELKGMEDAVRSEDIETAMYYSMALGDLQFLQGGLVWFGDREGFMPEIPIGYPQDYLPIRDNYDALKAFIDTNLDKGRVHAGGGTHGDTSRETNYADYIAWLHRANSNQAFRRSHEKATTELLGEAFDREYEPLHVSPALQKQEEEFQRFFGDADKWLSSMFEREIGLSGALRRIGLSTNVADEDRDFKARFEAEVKKTERPITLEEVYGIYGGTKECLKELWGKGNFSGVIKAHFDEIPDELKAGLRTWYINDRAKKMAVRTYSPQFTKLVGLLDVVSHIGARDERFIDSYRILRQRAEERFMIDAPRLVHQYSESDIYRSILIALSAVQQGTELEQFWLDAIRSDPRSERIIASVHGLLSMLDSRKQRRQLIPSLLERLQQRAYDADKTYQRDVIPGMYRDENFLNDILRHVNESCFPRSIYHHLDKEAGAIDFLRHRRVGDGSYTFTFTRYNPHGTKNSSVTFNVLGDTFSGDTELEGTVRAYLNEHGYELPNKVFVTSLEGRRISGTDTKMVAADGQTLDGLYEGVIGLNHTHFPFVYDAGSGTVLMAEPLDSYSIMFGVRNGWEGRRVGLDKVKEPVQYSQFQPLSSLNGKVNQLVDDKRKQGYLGDALYSLKDRLSDSISPYLSNVIRGRMVNHSDGLVQ